MNTTGVADYSLPVGVGGRGREDKEENQTEREERSEKNEEMSPIAGQLCWWEQSYWF